MKTRWMAAALLAFVAAAPAAHAATPDDHPGVVSIDWPSKLGVDEPTVTVHLGQSLLQFMTTMTSEAANEAAEVVGLHELVSQVRLVHVEVYKGNKKDFTSAAEVEVEALLASGWESVVRARDGDDRADVLIRMEEVAEDPLIQGIVVIAGEPNELAFINVAGDFDPALLGRHFGAVIREAKSGKLNLKELLNEEVVEEILEELD